MGQSRAQRRESRVSVPEKRGMFCCYIQGFTATLAPPKVPEKPTSYVSPEKLSFREKLALHKKVADSESGPAPPLVPKRPRSGSDATKIQRPFSTMVITEEPESSSLTRTLSEGELESEAPVEGTKIERSVYK